MLTLKFQGLKHVRNSMWLITDLPSLPGSVRLFSRERVGSVCHETLSCPARFYFFILFFLIKNHHLVVCCPNSTC